MEILESRSLNPHVIEYLKGELTKDILQKIVSSLKIRPQELLRLKETEALNLPLNLENDEEVMATILKHPQILERPIIIQGEKVIIGRPPEKVLEILKD
jgi:arsenate reductase (glutaredoxin)